jgi:predicted ArsR family transcriptional regulator
VEGAEWEAVATLIDPVRRSLFEHVRRQRRPVTREEAADAVMISRTLTAFHLDKLVQAGLLQARYEAPPDRPRGRGRTPKVYEAAAGGLMLSVPPRRYELIGEILVDAVATAPENARAAAQRHATDIGTLAGRASRVQTTPGATADEAMVGARQALADLGFEPHASESAGVALANCPFQTLAARQPELVCGLNQALIAGLLVGLGATTLSARLSPRPGECCVHVVARDDNPLT